MKIAEPDSIKAGEQELINSIMEHLNSEIIESIASGKLTVNNLEFRNGDMVIHKNRIVYKMEFQTTVGISVLFDREGNLIDEDDDSIENEDAFDNDISDETSQVSEPVEEEGQQDNIDSGDFDFDAIKAEAAAVVEDSEEDDPDELENVLAKTRNFWLQQTQEAIEPPQTESTTFDEEDLQAVMQKNKDFWQKQSEAAAADV